MPKVIEDGHVTDPMPGFIINALDTWLDRNVSERYKEEPLAQNWARLSKIGEEYGEAVAAFIGITGQNPRKGFTHSMDAYLNEVADTMITAVLCMQHSTKDVSMTRELLAARWEYRYRRMLEAGDGLSS